MDENQLQELYPDSYDFISDADLIHCIIEDV